MLDLRDPTLDARLKRRTPEGRYEISEIELVMNIRAYKAKGDIAGVQRLSEILLNRCAPAFQYHSQGLRHRPVLREEAIANMAEHLLREAQDPNETFITQNFIHYLRCLCIDEFKRVLRQEGMTYRRDNEGRPVGRQQHVPSALIEPLQSMGSDESSPSADVADPQDQYETLHALDESLRILQYLDDPLDRQIMVLRSLQEWKWDDIALFCKRNERTVRLRYERAREVLRQRLLQEKNQEKNQEQILYTQQQ
ncbi:MAG: hypothetical protein IMW89_00185 [Ktedonobacteraceae bacterium]|nr:hypothetical protein [Ktedonobacteraceae bacterium]